MRRFLSIMIFLSLVIPNLAISQDDPLRLIEKKQKELREREESIKKEEERLRILKRDVEEGIDKYSKLLKQIEEQLKEIKKARDERFELVVKTFEAMPPEDAAARLSEVDERTAAKILSIMKPKKAAAIMAVMEPKKVSLLTMGVLNIEKKIPTR